MQYWEHTKAKAIQTKAVWHRSFADVSRNAAGYDKLSALIFNFEALVQARAAAQSGYLAALSAERASLDSMRLLSIKIAAMIESQLCDDASIMAELRGVYAIQPRTKGSILDRIRALLPLWSRANATLSAMGGLTELVRPVRGVAFGCAATQALLDGYSALADAVADCLCALNVARANLRAHVRACDGLLKAGGASSQWSVNSKQSQAARLAARDAAATMEGATLPRCARSSGSLRPAISQARFRSARGFLTGRCALWVRRQECRALARVARAPDD